MKTSTRFPMSPYFILRPLLLSFLVCSGTLPACSYSNSMADHPLRTVSHVDLPRYMGDWRVIANIPYFAEKGCVDSIESYALEPDDSIKNWFTYRKKTFTAPAQRINAKAYVVNHQTNAEWKVKFFFGLISVKYLVLDLDPDYQWTVVGHPSRNYGWIMARGETLPADTYAAILKRLQAQGYDPAKFVKVPQIPEQ